MEILARIQGRNTGYEGRKMKVGNICGERKKEKGREKEKRSWR
jgi:hypothetical protein